MAISLNQSILKAKNSDGEWQNLSAIGQIEGYTKAETDTLFNSHTPQLLFSGVTSASAPAIVDLSGYGMVYIRVDRWESGCLVETQGQYDITTIKELLDTPSYNTITIGAAASQKVIISGTLDSCSMYNNSSRHTLIYGITQHTVLAITTQPTDLAMTVGETDTFHVDAVGDELTYQWYISTDGGVNWRGSGTTGNKTDTLYINNAKVDYNGYKYKCKITDKYGATVTSDVATLTVTS